MVVKTAFVDSGMAMKRILPAPMGRAFRMRKRSNHVTIVVAAKEEKAKPVQPKKAAKPVAEKKEAPKKKAATKTAKPAKPAAKESK